MLGCSLALTLSLWVGRTHEALMCTYAIWFLWLLGGRMVGILASTIGWPLTAPVWKSQPFLLALAPIFWPGSVRAWDYVVFAVMTGVISSALVGVAMLRLRSVCTGASDSKARRSSWMLKGGNIWRLFNKTIPWLTPSLDGNPVAWREWHRSRPSRWSMLITVLYGGLSLLFSILAIFWPTGRVPGFVNAAQVASGLLLLSVTAAITLAEERARGSLDLLMSTPLSTRQIVVGKWLGSFRAVPPLAIMPAFMIGAIGYVTEWRNWWWGVTQMILFVLSAGAAITSLGLAMATRFSRLDRAVGSTVTVYVLITVGWVFLVAMLFGPASQWLASGSPMLWTFDMTTDVLRSGRFQGTVIWKLFWIVFYGLAAAGILLATLSSFDRRLGRIDDFATWFCLPSRLLRLITVLYFAGAGFFTFFLLNVQPASTTLPFGVGVLFSLGILLLLVRASWPGAEDRVKAPAILRENARFSTAGILRAKWGSAGRLVPGVVILPLILGAYWMGSMESDWLAFAIMLVFMLAVSAAAVSFGVAIFDWWNGRAWAVICTTAIWALSCAGWIALARAGLFDPDKTSLVSSHPYFGLITLTFWASALTAGDFRVLCWATGASSVFATLAGVLFLVAQARDDLSRTFLLHQQTRNSSQCPTPV